jgi:hypothetical protein
LQPSHILLIPYCCKPSTEWIMFQNFMIIHEPVMSLNCPGSEYCSLNSVQSICSILQFWIFPFNGKMAKLSGSS